MTDETRIKLIGAGLILATIVVGFLIFSQRFSASKTNLDIPSVEQAVSTPLPSPVAAVSPTVSSQVAEALPKTGFPTDLFALLALSSVIAGWGLRKFPN